MDLIDITGRNKTGNEFKSTHGRILNPTNRPGGHSLLVFLRQPWSIMESSLFFASTNRHRHFKENSN